MIQIAIDIGWLIISGLILGGAVYGALYVIEYYWKPLNPGVKMAIWIIFIIIFAIAAASLLIGGSGSMRPPSFYRP